MTMIWNMIVITIGMVWGTFLWMVRLLLTPIVSSMVWLEWKRQGTARNDWLSKVSSDTMIAARNIYAIRDLIQYYIDEYLY